MNFLGHYYLDKDKNNPYFTFGALLPDLVRGFSKIYNQIDKNYSSEVFSHQSIYLGIKRHLKTDEIFHNLPSFHYACDLIDAHFKSSQIVHVPKSFFVSHILTELLIDKFIVHTDIQIAHQFYRELKVLDKSMLITYCESIHFFEFESVFLPRFNLFIQNEYALKLFHNENVYTALEKICFDRLNYMPSEFEKKEISRIIEQTDIELQDIYQTILSQTKEKLNYD